MRGLQERGTVAPLTSRHRVPGIALTPTTRRVMSIAIAMAAVGLDQVTKTLALHYLSNGPAHVLGPLRLNLVFNSGAAFSIGTGLSPLLAAVAIVVVVILWRMAGRSATTVACVSLGLILGGAVGNLVDRLLRGNGGAVIDFIDFKFWPTFNVADSCIVIGVVLLVSSRMGRTAR